MHPRLMHIRRGLVQRADQQFYKPVHLRLVLVMVGQFKRIVEEYVS